VKFNLNVLCDEEFRKQIKQAVLNQAKSLARSEVDLTVKAEVSRLAAKLFQDQPSWLLKSIVLEAVRAIIGSSWGEIGKMVEEKAAEIIRHTVFEEVESAVRGAVVKAVNDEVKKKMKAKTIWDAQGQADFLRAMVREEVARLAANERALGR
jgi:hypothetical protein